MVAGERTSSSTSGWLVVDGRTYDHADHGHVVVTGIWHRTRQLDEASETDVDADGPIVVRFVPGENGTWIDELAESLDTFLDAIG